ncbi:MAG: hypothetical protein FJX30_00865 [Alphaproteobacteria bacterium]|nr:hypothetical protein [Alphaproteobacteria bacterium]
MKKFRNIFTLFIFIHFLALFSFFSISSANKAYQILGVEIESELESEVECEAEIKSKSKNHQLKESNLSYFFNKIKFFKFNLVLNSELHSNYILEVPTTPPNNC